MVKIAEKGDKKVYQCQGCGFHYADEVLAQKCEAWCKEHKSCNLEITAHAVENNSDYRK